MDEMEERLAARQETARTVSDRERHQLRLLKLLSKTSKLRLYSAAYTQKPFVRRVDIFFPFDYPQDDTAKLG